jgi:hypothetical protein
MNWVATAERMTSSDLSVPIDSDSSIEDPRGFVAIRGGHYIRGSPNSHRVT